MIAKITSGGGFRGVLDYLMNEKKQQKELEKSLEKAAKQAAKMMSETTPEHEELRRTNATKVREQTLEKEPSGELMGEQKGTENSSAERELFERENVNLGERAARHRIIGGNMSGQTPRELAQEFGAFREQRPDIEKPVHHASLSAARGEKLPVEKWNEIAEKYVERMGFGNSPYIVVQHLDTEHEHIHIVTSRIDTNGKVVSDFQSKMRAEKVMREVEVEHKLQCVTPSRETPRRAPTRGELEELSRTGEHSAKMRLQDTIDRALRNQPDVAGFISQLDKAGVKINPNLQGTDRVSGISFEHNGEVLKGSNLGRGYSWQGLQKRGLDYDQQRDLAPLKEAKVKYLEAQLERQQEAVPAPALIEETKREIAELRQSLPAVTTLTREQMPEQGHDIQFDVRRNLGAPEPLIDEPVPPIITDVLLPVTVQNPLVPQYQTANFNVRQTPGGEPSGRELFHSLDIAEQNISGQELLAKTAGYDLSRSAEELLREATQPAYQATEERDNELEFGERDEPEQESPIEAVQSPETPSVDAIPEEIEIEEQTLSVLELLL